MCKLMEDDGLFSSDQKFVDIDQYMETLKGWDLEVGQLSAGQWRGRQQVISTDDYEYLFFSHSLKCLYHAVLCKPGFSFFIPLTPEHVTYLFYKTDRAAISSTPFGETLSLITPDEFEGVTLTISYERYHYLLEHRYNSPVCCPTRHKTTIYYPSEEQLHTLQKELLQIRSAFSKDTIIQLQPMQWLQYISDTVVAPLLVSIMANETNTLLQGRISPLLQALDIIAENLDSPPTVQELSERLNLTPRYLQLLFKKNLNLSPKQFIRFCRLNRARSYLYKSKLQKGSISDVANELGYWHMSNFSQEFKLVFGATPTEFVKNNRKVDLIS